MLSYFFFLGFGSSKIPIQRSAARVQSTARVQSAGGTVFGWNPSEYSQSAECSWIGYLRSGSKVQAQSTAFWIVFKKIPTPCSIDRGGPTRQRNTVTMKTEQPRTRPRYKLIRMITEMEANELRHPSGGRKSKNFLRHWIFFKHFLEDKLRISF